MSSSRKKKIDRSGNLKIGDTVLLRRKGKIKSGYVMTDLSGFQSPELLLVKPSGGKTPDLPDIQLGTFQIVAANKYDAQTRKQTLTEKERELSRLKESSGEFNVLVENYWSVMERDTIEENEREEKKKILAEIKKLERIEDEVEIIKSELKTAEANVNVEFNENEAKQRQLRGNFMRYGEIVQLRHTLTGKYVCVSGTGTSSTERSRLRVFLQEKDSLGCMFRLHPHIIKDEAVGDAINYHDQIKFESLAIPGQFLHCSEDTFKKIGITANSECFELNLSATDSPLQVIPHYQTTSKEAQNVLRASGVVRLYNHKHNCYIAGEGSFAEEYCAVKGGSKEGKVDDRVIQKDVHFRRKRIKAGLGSSPSTSPNIFWQIEKYAKPSSGEPMQWKEECRIKHLPSRRHLAVYATKENYEVTLKSKDLPESATVFQLHSAVHLKEEARIINYHSYVRVRHKETKTWLHFDKDQHFIPKKSGSDDDYDSGESRELFKLIASRDISLDDAFAIEKVKDDYVADFNYVSSVTTVLANQVQKCESCNGGDPHTVKAGCHMMSTLASLEYLKDLIVKDEDSVKFKQKLIRSMSTLKLVICLMNFHDAERKEKGDDKKGAAKRSDTAKDSKTSTKDEDQKDKGEDSTAKKTGEAVSDGNLNDEKENESEEYDYDDSDYYFDSDHDDGNYYDHDDDDEQKLDQRVCTTCYGIYINFLQGNSSKNKNYVSQNIASIFSNKVWNTEFRGDLSAEEVLVGIAKDDHYLQDVLWICNILMRKLERSKKLGIDAGCRMVRLLNGLGALCACKGVPQSKVQDAILEWIKDHEVLYRIKMEWDPVSGLKTHLTPEPPESSTKDVTITAEVAIDIEPAADEAPLISAVDDSISTATATDEALVPVKGPLITLDTTDEVVPAPKEDNKSDSEIKLQIRLRILVAQFGLLVMMCKGSNYNVIRYLKSDEGIVKKIGVQLNFDFIMGALKIIEHLELRAKLIELLQVTYVEVGKNKPFLEKIPLSFKIYEVHNTPFESTAAAASTDDDAAHEKEAIRPESIVNPEESPEPEKYDPKLKAWIHDCLIIRDFWPGDKNEVEPWPGANEGDKNQVIVRILQLLAVLVEYGYYDEAKDVNKLIPLLFKLLEGEKDYLAIDKGDDEDKKAKDDEKGKKDATKMKNREAVTKEDNEKFKKGGRYSYKEDYHYYYQIKHCAMEVLNLFFNFQLYKNLHNLIYNFRWLLAEPLTCDQPSMPPGYMELKERHIDGHYASTVFEKPSGIDADVSEVHTSLKSLTRDETDRNPYNMTSFQAAKKRLEEIMSLNLAKEDIASFKLPKILLDVANYEAEDLVQGSMLLLDRYYSSESSIFQKALKCQLLRTSKSMALYDIIDKKVLPFLPAYFRNDKTDSSELSPIEKLTRSCWLEDEVEGFEPHHINQNIILSFGICSDVLKYVTHHCSQSINDRGIVDKLNECLRLLRGLACQNSEVQKSVLQHLDVFLKACVKGSGQLDLSIGLLLQETFKGGPSVTLSVKEDHIVTMMNLLLKKGSSSDPAILCALTEILMIKKLDLPLKHNQLIVAKHFSLMREDSRYWCKDLLAEGKEEERLKILTQKGEEGIDKCKNLLMITDLLATCAFGENAGAESVCCTVFTLEELLKIIGNEDINIYRKLPFMRFLIMVYMEEKGKKKSQLMRINRNLEDHISQVAKVLLQTCHVMKDDNYLSIKKLLIAPSWKYAHTRPDPLDPITDPITVESSKEPFHISDVLLYVSEGFLPFLNAFYSQAHKNQQDAKVKKLAQKIANTIHKALTAFYHVMSGKKVYFDAEFQLKPCIRAYFWVEKFISPDLDLTKEEFEAKNALERSLSKCTCNARGEVDHVQCFHTLVKSEARRDYEDKYKDENELNERFRCFVTNFKRAYEGDDTRKSQIDSKLTDSKLTDSKLIEYSVEGPTALPLGSSFQQHVAAFDLTGLTDEEMKKILNPKDRLLKQLEISLSRTRQGSTELDEDTQQELDVKCLQILRALIYNKFIFIDPEDKERNPEKYRTICKRELHPIQCEIQKLGTVSRIIPLLAHPNERIVNEVLVLLLALLESGNIAVQNGFAQLQGSPDNALFPTLEYMLRSAAVLYKESQCLIEQLKVQTTFDSPMLQARRLQRKKQTSKFSKKGKQVDIEGHHRFPFLNIYQHPSENYMDKKALSVVDFHDHDRATLIIKVIGLMCDGQHREMQNYLREQRDSIRNINIVEEITSFLHECLERRHITSDILPLIIEAFQALIELCSGNYENSEVIFKKQIVSMINYFLQIDITNIKLEEIEENELSSDPSALKKQKEAKKEYIILRSNMLKLKAAVVELLEVMLEKVSSETEKLTQQIAERLNIRALHLSMLDFDSLQDDQDLKDRQDNDNALRALFKTYSVINSLISSQAGSEFTPKETDCAYDAWEFCKSNTHSIEIAYKNEEDQEEIITKVHFNVGLKVDIKEELKDTVKYQVERGTHADKMRDFHEWMDAVKRDTLHHDLLETYKLNFVAWLSRKRYWFLILLTVILNIIVLATYQAPAENLMESTNRTIPTVPELNTGYRTIFYGLGALHTFLALWMVLEYFVGNWPHFVLPEFLCEIPLPAMPRLLRHYQTWRLLQIWRAQEKLKIPLLSNFTRTKSSINLLGFTTIYILIFLASSVLSLAFFGYFYSLCLLYMIIENDILQRALQSVTKNWKSLLWVALLLLAILFIYATISFAVYNVEFEDPENVRFCQNLEQCFVTVLRFGLIDSFLEFGVRGDSRDDAARGASYRFFFDISFFIIVSTIGLNIVFGIIIDTFSELRDARFSAEQDMKSTCFICSLPSHKFDQRAADGFKDHIEKDHNMWAYIYYSIYLDQVDTNNHNAIEKYVYKKIRDKNADYIPQNKALVFKDEKDDSEELKEQVKELRKSMKDQKKALRNQQKALQDRLDDIVRLVQAK